MSRAPVPPDVPPGAPPAIGSPLRRLRDTPRRFRFDAAVRLLTLGRRRTEPADVARFRTPAGMTYPPADVLDLVHPEGRAEPDVTVGMIGLTGPSGVLPRHYTDTVIQMSRMRPSDPGLRVRGSSLHVFFDMLGHRLVAFFARAGAKYRPARAIETAALTAPRGSSRGEMRAGEMPDRDPISLALLALTGHATGHLTNRTLIAADPLLHYAGLFAMRPRSADRLGAMASDWLGMRVEVIEFAGAWLSLPPDQRTRIGARGAGQFNRLGLDAAAGVRAWDPQARIILRLGPLDRPGFERMLPDRLPLHRLVSLVRAYVGLEIGFAVNPVLASGSVPPLRLDAAADPPPRLGWNTWLEPADAGRRTRDAADAVFEAEIIEAQTPITSQTPIKVRTPAATPHAVPSAARQAAPTRGNTGGGDTGRADTGIAEAGFGDTGIADAGGSGLPDDWLSADDEPAAGGNRTGDHAPLRDANLVGANPSGVANRSADANPPRDAKPPVGRRPSVVDNPFGDDNPFGGPPDPARPG